MCYFSFCFCKQKTAYEMRISDWSSDVCSSDLHEAVRTMIAKSRKFGFVGGSCIHPAIVPLLDEGFSPPEEDVKSAQRLCAEFDKAVAEGRGSLTVDGKGTEERRVGKEWVSTWRSRGWPYA